MTLARSAVVVLLAFFATLNYVYAVDDNSEKLSKNDAEVKDKVSYSGAKLLRLRNVDTNLKNKLEELEEEGVLETWNANTTVHDIMVRSEKLSKVTDLLSLSNMTFQVVIEDIQRAIIDENPEPNEAEAGNERQKPFKLNWQRYFRYDDHQEFLTYLDKQHSFVSVIDIGSSIEGRPMKVIKISSGQPNAKAIWIDGGTHAREWISPATVSYLIHEFTENRPAHDSSISGIDFYMLPILNPDGYEYSHTTDRLWRKNRHRGSGSCSGIDLNRNWGYKWGGAGSSRQPCKEIFAGSNAFSEPETKAVSKFVLSIKDQLKAYVTFHSYGQYILYPWGYAARVPPDYADLDRVGRKVAAAIQKAGGPVYTVGNSASTLYSASGGADDWAKGVAGIKYTYTIELRDNGIYGFVLPASFIEQCGKETLAGIKVIAEEVKNTT